MKIKIKNHDLELHYSLRILVNYEELTGKSLDFNDMNNFSSLIKLFYATVVASLQYSRQELDVTYEDFYDYIDNNGNFTLLKEFGDWFAQVFMANLDVENNKVNKDNKKTQKKSDLKLEKNV